MLKRINVLTCKYRSGVNLMVLASLLVTLSPRTGVESNNCLYMCLVVHVHDEFATTFGGHRIRAALKSFLTSEEIMHTNDVSFHYFKNVQ